MRKLIRVQLARMPPGSTILTHQDMGGYAKVCVCVLGGGEAGPQRSQQRLHVSCVPSAWRCSAAAATTTGRPPRAWRLDLPARPPARATQEGHRIHVPLVTGEGVSLQTCPQDILQRCARDEEVAAFLRAHAALLAREPDALLDAPCIEIPAPEGLVGDGDRGCRVLGGPRWAAAAAAAVLTGRSCCWPPPRTPLRRCLSSTTGCRTGWRTRGAWRACTWWWTWRRAPGCPWCCRRARSASTPLAGQCAPRWRRRGRAGAAGGRGARAAPGRRAAGGLRRERVGRAVAHGASGSGAEAAAQGQRHSGWAGAEVQGLRRERVGRGRCAGVQGRSRGARGVPAPRRRRRLHPSRLTFLLLERIPTRRERRGPPPCQRLNLGPPNPAQRSPITGFKPYPFGLLSCCCAVTRRSASQSLAPAPAC
jgi:hypothetical protein